MHKRQRSTNLLAYGVHIGENIFIEEVVLKEPLSILLLTVVIVI